MASSVASASEELLDDDVAELPELPLELLVELPLVDEPELLPPDVWLLPAVAGVAPVWLVEPSCTANIAPPTSAASSDPRLPTPESCGPGALLGKVLFKCDRTSR